MKRKLLVYVFTLVMIFLLAGCQTEGDKVLVSKKSIINGSEYNYSYVYDNDLLIELYIDGELSESYEYDEDANLIKVNGSNYEAVYEYQNGNRIKAVTTLDSGAVLHAETEYNADNNLVKVTSFADDELIGICKYKYTESENVQTCKYENGEVVENISTLDDYGNEILMVAFRNGEESQVMEKKYNSDNLLIESTVVFSDGDGKIVNYYEYDKYNNLIASYEKVDDGERELIDSYVYE